MVIYKAGEWAWLEAGVCNSQVSVISIPFQGENARGRGQKENRRKKEKGPLISVQPCRRFLSVKRDFYFLTTLTCLWVRLWVSVKHLQTWTELNFPYLLFKSSSEMERPSLCHPPSLPHTHTYTQIDGWRQGARAHEWYVYVWIHNQNGVKTADWRWILYIKYILRNVRCWEILINIKDYFQNSKWPKTRVLLNFSE